MKRKNLRASEYIIPDETVETFPVKKKQIEKNLLLYKIRLFFIVLMIVITAVLFSPIFQAKNIVVSKLQCFSSAEICEKIGLNEESNIIFFGKIRAKKILEKSPYIEEANLSIQLPNTIHIHIKERKVRGYIPYMGSYLYIDEYGRVLDTQKSFSKALPIVDGLQFDRFQLGDVLKVENQDSFDVVVKIAQMMTKYQLLDMVVKVDVSDPKDVHAYVNKVDILLGDIVNCDQKVKTMSEILKKIPEKDRGTLDLRDMSKPIVFRYLT